jgi:hypothetical protein
VPAEKPALPDDDIHVDDHGDDSDDDDHDDHDDDSDWLVARAVAVRVFQPDG